MYEHVVPLALGCSIRGIAGMHNPESGNLKKLLHDAANICVTSDNYQPKAKTALRKAGFIPLVTYKNYASGHGGNRCTLWAAFGERSAPVILPDKPIKKKPKPKSRRRGVIKIIMEGVKKRK